MRNFPKIAPAGGMGFTGALLFGLAVFAPVFLASRAISAGTLSYVYPLVWSLFTGGIAFFIVHTGRVSFYRRIFFAALALSFLVHFKSALLSAAFAPSCLKDAPFCHISIAPSFFNYLYQQYLALMSGDWKLWGPLTLAFLWLFFTLVIGRAWCSWACFYGGIDDSLSALPRKALFRSGLPAGAFRDFPAALLIFLLLVSLAYMLPVYCLWLCPLKMTTAFLEPDDASIRGVQVGLMLFALAVLLAGPLLSRKRTFCSFLCPFGAWQAFWGRLNPFRISVDKAACSGCSSCAEACPMCAIRPGEGGKPEITAYCNLCGECLPACPAKALRYSVPGAEGSAAGLLDPEKYFVFSALATGGAFGALFAPAALSDLVRIITR